MTKLLKQIMDEYDAAKNDASWDQGHPIFQMAEHIDMLKNQIAIFEGTQKEEVTPCKNIQKLPH